MNKTYFEVFEDDFQIPVRSAEIDMSADEIFDRAAGGDVREPNCIGRFETEAEAEAAFEAVKAKAYTRIERANVGYVLRGRVYSVEGNIFSVDDDGEEEFEQSGYVGSYAAVAYCGKGN